VQQRRAALKDITAETSRLRSLEQDAARSLAQTQSAMQDLQLALTRAKATQKQAEAVLSQFLGGWSQAVPLRAAELNRTYAQLAAKMGKTTVPSTGHWTAAAGASAAWRALRTIGTPYAWAGGSSTGPTAGVCAAGAAANDCHIVGFDCSGLALYAWAPYLSMPHFAADQYRSGRVHPTVSQLRLGDLVFWSSDGSAAGIHHVAIYVGSGNVVQAPQSGDIVRVTPLARVDAGYFGAARPMS
jgi:cell wall-associated NlpC family hydrolase